MFLLLSATSLPTFVWTTIQPWHHNNTPIATVICVFPCTIISRIGSQAFQAFPAEEMARDMPSEVPFEQTDVALAAPATSPELRGRPGSCDDRADMRMSEMLQSVLDITLDQQPTRLTSCMMLASEHKGVAIW